MYVTSHSETNIPTKVSSSSSSVNVLLRAGERELTVQDVFKLLNQHVTAICFVLMQKRLVLKEEPESVTDPPVRSLVC